MPTDPDAPLPPPPRPAHLRRGVRNLRRAYRSLVALIVLVLGGWAALDTYHWNELPEHVRILDLGFGLAALIALIVWRQVEKPIGRRAKARPARHRGDRDAAKHRQAAQAAGRSSRSAIRFRPPRGSPSNPIAACRAAIRCIASPPACRWRCWSIRRIHASISRG